MPHPLTGVAGLAVAGALLASACAAPSAGPAGGPLPAEAPRVERGAVISLPPTALTPEQQALHALRRLGYGPRPGDVERVRRMGVEAWVAQQLAPAGIEDAAVEAWLARLPTLGMSIPELIREYPRPDPALQARVASGEMSPGEMRAMAPPERRPYRAVAELQSARMVRAVWGERQLEEVMVDFWFNHFNVYALKGPLRWMVASYEREAIRPHALGRFRDLLGATARHPAMQYYLDNWLSVRDGLVPVRGPLAGRRLGLNENYARELLELHTLGVDGGYTQRDVVEVARCFTGWSVERPFEVGRFVFRAGAHDRGAKEVLGHVISAGGGEDDGQRVLDLLARHPSTARFVAGKLVRRLVSDDPPAPVVERAARAFRDSDGDVRATLVAIVTAPEFWSSEAYRAKVKKPIELVASAARALDLRLAGGPGTPGPGRIGLALARAAAGLGEPLYEAVSPTGHPDGAEAWVNAGALLGRMNFALALAQGRVPGASVDVPGLAGGPGDGPTGALDRLLRAVLHGEASAETRAAIERTIAARPWPGTAAPGPDPGSAGDLGRLAALVLASPEFQRR